MVTPELIAFIKASLEQGDSVETIKKTLFANGWAETDVQEGVWVVQNEHNDANNASTTQSSQETKTDTDTNVKKKKVFPKTMMLAVGMFVFVLVVMLAVVFLRK